MSYDAIAGRALDTAAARGAHYADVRFEEQRNERIEVRNGLLVAFVDTTSIGYGMRALVAGAWGFAASDDCSERGVDETAVRAVAMAQACAAVSPLRIGAAPTQAYRDRFVTPCAIDPREIPLGERVARLLTAERDLHVDPSISVGRAWIDLWRSEKTFYSSIGSRIEQTILQTGCGMAAMAVAENDIQIRTFPGDVGLYQSGGWEIVERAALADNAARIGAEAAALLRAPQCPSGVCDLILGSSQVSLQIHESCGHPAELDRVLGWEANFSGTSFLELGQLDTLHYASRIVSIAIDNTLEHGMATAGYDDEGTKSRRSDLVRDGILVGYETSNDTARMIGRESNACVRAQSWEYVPMIRMCNLVLAPGDVPFEHLFDDIRDGVYMESNRSWSIDDRRLNFQFGCEIAWEVKNGKRGRMLKNPTYAGMTPIFWNACDAIGDADSWFAWGTPNCGKGEPLQTGRTTQATSPARFRQVDVGVGYHE